MYYEYALAADTRTPIMLLDGEIGEQVRANQFCREMLELSRTADVIQIWINSIGGSVIDAYQIISTINKLSVPVDTYNIGMAASAAFDIFVHGRNRYMMDYAQVMTHNVVGGGDQEQRWNESVATILANKSGKTIDEIKELMNAETWMNATECLNNGFCDEIELTSYEVEDVENKSNLTLVAHKFIEEKSNQFNINYMKSVANKLGLNEAAKEEQVLEAINMLEQAKAKAETDATNAASKLVEVQNTLKTTQEELQTAKTKIEEVENAALEVKVSNLITEAQSAGRLPKASDDASKEVLNHWTSLAKEKFETAKNLIEALPVNKKAPILPIDNFDDLKGAANMANEMAKINSKTRNK